MRKRELDDKQNQNKAMHQQMMMQQQQLQLLMQQQQQQSTVIMALLEKALPANAYWPYYSVGLSTVMMWPFLLATVHEVFLYWLQ